MRRAFLSGALGAVAARGALAALRAYPPGGEKLWRRTNHRGEPITLLEGPAYVLAAGAAAALAPGVPPRVRAAGAVAVLGAGAFGAVDDLAEGAARKGLRGHLGELAQGRLTTGGLKVLGIGATGVAAAVLALPAPDFDPGAPGQSWARGRGEGKTVHDHGSTSVRDHARFSLRAVPELLVAGGVVAGAANVLNLLDLRPGRALKVALALSVPLADGVGAGVAAALLPEDLAEGSMLGDTGANAAGALLGVAALRRLGPRGRAGALAVLVGLTLASEKVSFTKVIEGTPGLREFDALGRRPR